MDGAPPADDAAAPLQAVGVAACEVYDNTGVLADPQVRIGSGSTSSRRAASRRRRVQRPPDPAGAEPGLVAGRPVDGRGHPPGADERAGMSLADVDALIASGAAFTEADPRHVAPAVRRRRGRSVRGDRRGPA